MTKVVDARGLSCPQPVLLAKRGMAQHPNGAIEVLVDSTTSRDNVTRLAQKQGWQVDVREEAPGTFRLVLSMA